MKLTIKYAITFVIVAAVSWISVEEAEAQVAVGLDVNSRFLWRGFDFGNSPSIQPEVTYTAGSLEVGTWGAFATTGNPDGTEIDFFASYGIPVGEGELDLSISDYGFPEATPDTDYFSDDVHLVELGAGYSGPLSDMTSFYVDTGIFVIGDDDNAIYSEWGLSFETGEVTTTLFAGFTPSESTEYATDGFAFINTGASFSRAVDLTDSFSLGLNSTLMINPNDDNIYFMVGISI